MTDALRDKHQQLLIALRQREQDVIRYLAILVPAFGGFYWLIDKRISDNLPEKVFLLGGIGIQFILTVGAAYTLMLSYNYRYIVIQLAKLESKLNLENATLEGWLKWSKDGSLEEYQKRMGNWWKMPPEIMKVFWVTFLISIFFVTLIQLFYLCTPCYRGWSALCGALGLVIGAVLMPESLCSKLQKILSDEIHTRQSPAGREIEPQDREAE